jgi:hypothetical protein
MMSANPIRLKLRDAFKRCLIPSESVNRVATAHVTLAGGISW